MTFPSDLEVGLFIDGEWVDAINTGEGVMEGPGVVITRGRPNWSSRVDSSRATFTLDNDDGRWSPDNPTGPYFGQFKRNIPCRVGKAYGLPYLEAMGGNAASTPDIPGAGGGTPTAPSFVSVTQDAETSYVTLHQFSMPASLAGGDRLLALVSAGHDSITPTDQGGGVTDMDGWELVTSGGLYSPWNGILVYERGPLTAGEATTLQGSVVEFSTAVAVRSSWQVIRTSGAREGGRGVAWDFSIDAVTAYDGSPNPPSLTVPWGADQHRWYAVAFYGSAGESVSAYPSSYTSMADGNLTAAVQIASAHRTTTAATENPGAFTLTDVENHRSMTFAYRAVEDTSSDGALDISGDIDLRIGGRLFKDLVDIVDGGSKVRLAHKNSGGNGWEWELYGALGAVVSNFVWYSSTGRRNETSEATGSAIPLDFMYRAFALRVTLDVDNGAGGHDVDYFTSDAVGGSWSQVGSTITRAGTTNIVTNDAPVRVGGNPADVTHIPFPGRIDEFEMLDGIGGTKVADVDFTAQAVGATSFTGTDGLPWTIGVDARITKMNWRFHGELSSIPVRWNLSATQILTAVEAQGLFRRLRQGAKRLDSPIRRAILRSATNVVQYWPMEEEGETVSTFGPAVGTNGITITNGFPNAATSRAFVASEALPTPGDSIWTANVDAYTPTSAWQVRWLQSIPSNATGTDVTYLVVKTTDIEWRIQWRDSTGGQLRVLGYRGVTQIYDSAWTSFFATGKNWRMTLSIQQNGSNVNLILDAQDPGTGLVGGIYDTNAVGGSAGAVTQLKWNKDSNADDFAIGHVVVHSALTPLSQLANEVNAFDGERAGLRIMRLCLEEGLAFRIEGDPADTERMGAQRANTLMALLEECAATDLGILHEAKESVAVGYRTRTSMIDQTTVIGIDASAKELATSLEIDRDDPNFANDVEVENWNGTTFRAVLDDGSALSVSEPPVGAGRYARQFSINGQDSRLKALAESRLTLSTVDEPRVSRLAFALETPGAEANAALVASVLDSSLGDRITVTNNLAEVKATVDQIVQGYRETIRAFSHRFEFNTTPAAPWLTGNVVGPPATHTVTFRRGPTLATPGSPAHVLAALGYEGTEEITRAQLDAILDAWVASTGGTTRNVTSAATWATAMAAMTPGDLTRCTASFDPGGSLLARGDLYGLAGATLTSSPSGGQPGLPMIVTCADGVVIDDNNQSSNVPVLGIDNCRHVWAVGFNVREGQFGIRCQNWGGEQGFPAYVAYDNVQATGHAGMSASGWFQPIATSGGTPPAGAGNEWGFSEWFVYESNTINGVGQIAGQFGEALYVGRGGSPGWVSYARDFWIRGNDGTDWTSDGVDLKPGCFRGWITDNDLYIGHAIFGAPLSMLYVASSIDLRPTAWDFDPEIYVEGNRVSDSNVTNTDGSSPNIMGYLGLSGIRAANNVLWAHPQTGSHATWRARNEHGTNDTEALAYYRNDPTWVVNHTAWSDDSFENAGYGNPLVGAFPGTIDFDLRNNIVDNGSPATGEVDAAASDFIAPVPAIGAAGIAQWEDYGRGSAFDLDPDSALVGSGVSIADLELAIDADISQRPIPDPPNPGAFQPFPSS